MESTYDENLEANKFFKTLRTDYEDIFQKAVCDNWIICVPCSESLENYELSQDNLFTHLLIPNDELPGTHFRTLSELEVRIFDKLVKLKDSDGVPILFSEVFYVDDLRYEVFCLERPLNHNARSLRFNPRVYSVKNLRDCMDLLVLESSDESVMKRLDEIIKQFLFLSSKDYFCKTVDQQISFVREIYGRCFQVIQQDKNVSIKTNVNRIFMENVQIAVESYVLHNMYSIIMKGLITNMTEEIGSFNKTLRSLASIQLQHLKVVDTLLDCISTARNELSHFNNYTTVLGKLSCLKRCINHLSNKSADKLSADDLLPILVFLVVKSGIVTWMAQLKYVKEFSFSQMNQNHASESSFLVTTLEAIITFIESGSFYKSISDNEINLKMPEGEPNGCSYICSKNRLFWKTKHPGLRKLFQLIYNENLISAAGLLDDQVAFNVAVPTESQYCHPLCSCDRCEKLFASSRQAAALTVNSVSETGHSAMHVAACYDRCAIVDWLLGKGADPNCFDFFGWTPLHCAAAHGFQKTLLLLVYAGARLDRADDDGNQPLHLAAANGHADCVKALLYFAEQDSVRLDINAANKDGDTALHLAVKYYQKDIAEILLNYNANPMAKNKHENTVFELTESLTIKAILNERYDSVNLMNLPENFVLKADGSVRNKRRASKDEYGVQPRTAEAIRNAHQLFRAARYNDVKTMKRYLGFGTGDGGRNASSPGEPAPAYKCHPLCRCEKCFIEMAPVCEEDQDEFAEMDVVNANICDADGFTALHIACKYGSAQTVQFLLDVGAKINARTFKQLLTPLHITCIQNQPNVARILLDRSSCKVNLQDRSGNTALHYACMAGNRSMVELLLRYEPDLEVRNDKGKTPLGEAEECLSYTVMRMLKSSKPSLEEEQSW